jgi:hypothetical protein
MKSKRGLFAAVVLGVLLAGCAATGTRVTSSSNTYKDMAKSQGWWCGSFGSTCTCAMDGVHTTCSLVQACLSSGNCKAAS